MKVGDRLAKYRLTRPLGEGAMGVVWAAVNEDTQREVALKLLQSPDPEQRQRLLREAVASGRVDHRNVITIHDVGTTPEGEPFLVMQLLSGETLRDRIKREGKLAPAVAARIGAAIASGLEAAHGVGIVHRDLKPANVFLHRETAGREEVVKVVDFGVSRLDGAAGAKLTATGDVLGSPAYMSPEQAGGVAVLGPRSDLWSLGVVLFEMLAGRRPFTGASLVDVLLAVMAAPIPALPPEVPPDLAALVHACLQRDPDHRPASAAEVVDRLLARAGAAPPPAFAAPAPNFAMPTFAAKEAERGETLPMVSPAAQGATTPMAATPMLAASRQAAPRPTAATPVVRAGERPDPPPAASPRRASINTPLWLVAAAFPILGLLVVMLAVRIADQPPPAVTLPDAKAIAAPRAPARPARTSAEGTRSPPPPRAPPAPIAPAAVDREGRPAGATVEVVVSVDVPAQVFVDDHPVGATPLAPLALRPGTHALRFKHATLGERSLTVEVKEGVAMVVNVDFAKKDDADGDAG
jgi:serine/threonine-protein kinase